MQEKLSPILDDQPALTDALDFTSYVQTLRELIAHNTTQTPLTLGIFGRWGVGKTTLMRMLEKDLDKEGITTI
jgi:ATPase subunit of ABC transporter with duplicated ATPase domains